MIMIIIIIIPTFPLGRAEQWGRFWSCAPQGKGAGLLHCHLPPDDDHGDLYDDESSLMIFHLVVSIEVHERLWRDVNSSGEARALHDVGQRHIVWPFDGDYDDDVDDVDDDVDDDDDDDVCQRHIVWPFGGDDNNAINWNGTLEKWEMIALKALSMISVDEIYTNPF